MAFGTALTAALTYLGARNKARAEKAQQEQERQDKLNQQAIDNKRADANAQAERDWRNTQEHDDVLRIGIDQGRLHDERVRGGLNPDTGAENPLPQLPPSLTKGLQNSASAPLKAQMTNLLAAARVYAADPDPQSQELARQYTAQASLLKSLIEAQDRADAAKAAREAAQAATLQRLAVEHGYRVQEKGIPRAGRSGGGGRGGYGAASNAAGIGGLSPQGQQFFGMLTTTNNPATAAQAIMAIQNASGLSDSDKAILTNMVYGKRKVPGLTDTGAQQTQAANRSLKADSAASLDAEEQQAFSAIARLRSQGMTTGEIRAAIQASAKLSPEAKIRVLRTLGPDKQNMGAQ